jgi:glycosyltransferase involved in cell wall biosynthesis
MAQKCSVVIPAYNAAGFIRRTIDSVLAQTYRDYELIVVDDGSTDDTAEIVKSYGDRVRYIYQDNAGGGAGRNTGIAAAKYDWIALLDHDDEWLPEKLQAQMDLLERNPDLRWCGTNYIKVLEDRRGAVTSIKALRKALGDREYFESFLTTSLKMRFSLAPSAVVAHKEILEQVGGFERIHLADYDMWLKIAYRFPKLGFVPQSLTLMHLDNPDAALMRQRIAAKRGGPVRELIERHLKLAEEQESLDEFRPLAAKILRQALIPAVYHGFKADARLTIRQFGTFFPWYWRYGAYLLTIFPKATSLAAKFATYLAHKLKLERQVTRRWIYKKTTRKPSDTDS